jgi:putative acetyltransferase
MHSDFVIRPFQPGDAHAFRRLNEDWIIRYFTLEEHDRIVLADPEGEIIQRGGHIYMALAGNQPVGCCALIFLEKGRFELAKMTVAESFRGHGLGRRLLEHTIQQARALGANSLFLQTNSKLKDAIHLYESFGFRHLHPAETPSSPYSRADVSMTLDF